GGDGDSIARPGGDERGAGLRGHSRPSRGAGGVPGRRRLPGRVFGGDPDRGPRAGGCLPQDDPGGRRGGRRPCGFCSM
ncbi:MAG: hypothetical protein AVDCRST_MAG02-2771, partial [uncultured Rubrobacteraceae bacterium]